MEGFDSTIIIVAFVALLAWHFGQSTERKRVGQKVERLQGEVNDLKERVGRRPNKSGGGDYVVLIFIMAAAGGVAALVLAR
jgi:hypothetical protein